MELVSNVDMVGRFYRHLWAGLGQQRPTLQGRSVLAEAAAGQPDPRPGLRHRGRQQRHVWIMHRPGTLVDDEKGAQQTRRRRKCCKAAPPVLQFDAEGNLLRAWGGPGQGYDWPENEHGIHVDRDGNVWLAGNGKDDHQILKFTPDGKFLLQIGKPGAAGGSNATRTSSAGPRTW